MNEAHVPSTAVVRVSTGEDVHEGVDRDVVDVAQAGCVGFEFRPVGANPDDSPSVHGQLFSVRTGRVHKAKVPDRNVDPPVYSHAYSVRRVIHSPGLIEFSSTDLLDQMLGWSICQTVPIFVFQYGKKHAVELGTFTPFRMQDVELVSNRDDASGVVDHRIDRVRVVYSIVILVDEADDLSLPSSLAEGTDLIDPGIDLSGGGNPDTGNARRKGVGREQSRFQFFRDHDFRGVAFLLLVDCG